MKKICVYISFSIFSLLFVNANNSIDSLYSVIHSKQSNDSTKIGAYIELSFILQSNPLQVLILEKEFLKFCQNIPNTATKAYAFRQAGNINYRAEYYDRAIDLYFQSVRLYEKINDPVGVLRTYNNIGNAYTEQGIISNDSTAFLKAIEILNNAVILSKKHDTLSIHNLYNNIGNAYKELKQYKNALSYYNLSYPYYLKRKDNNGIEFSLINLGETYLLLAKETDKSEYYAKAMEYFMFWKSNYLNSSNNERQAFMLCNIGEVFMLMNDLQVAEKYLNEAYSIAVKTGKKDIRKLTAYQLSEIYKKKNNVAKAYTYMNIYTTLKDSLQAISSYKNMQLLQAFYESERKDREIETLKIETLEKDKKNAELRTYTIAAFAAGTFVLLIAFALFYLYRLKQKNNFKLKQAYSLLEISNKRISDSITYAKRIQSSVLPDSEKINKIFSESFVYFKPRDVVSGDFYWVGETSEHKFIVVADCTGHGVPGAILSMLAFSMLENVINVKKIEQPAKILLELDKQMISLLQQQNVSKQDDGMDISICRIDKNNNNLCFSGANQNAYLIHNNQIQTLSGSIFSIGGFNKNYIKEFKEITVLMEKNTMLYLSTDGFADQFGGKKGNKFLVSNLENLFVELTRNPVSEQLKEIDRAFLNWKGNQRQTDDVLVVGIRI
ncbi:hypothetical protein FLAV_00640 [Flavobacteriales bacterium]|nr:hypothetical protein [Flavobacteriales bacterium]MCL4815391.1 SpoIIE family protein phosphatase [Flavobacteriales bacterium]WKZ75010.1 MAG: SpoIIE family protein phosphatase [Vicingaceae bacterium]GIK69952.1 MAG: hypothetical protein BroJett020_12470 [Bacteroidota bacterium]CAG0959850.1 hypothetical protein FLAV_00640 [Flavobacteriales bacterium]